MLFPAVRHEVSFWFGGERLVGDLRVPRTAGPHPVVLVVGGADATDRDSAVWLDELADAGLAGFSWDRPVDRSGRGGDAVSRDAREVLAALDRLRCVPALDGVAAILGRGEGGWVALRAATFSTQVRAVVLACAPIVPSEDGHDPRPTLSGLGVPLFALFGELDPLVPAREAVRVARGVLERAGHREHELAVVRGADHDLRVPAPHRLGALVEGRHRFGDRPDGLTRLVADWLIRTLRPQPVPNWAPPAVPAPRSAPPGRTGPGPVEPAPRPVPVLPIRQHRRCVSS